MNRLSIVLLLAAGSSIAAPAWATVGVLATVDTIPPFVQLLPVEQPPLRSPLDIRARIADPSGVERATLWVRSGADTDFRALDMTCRGAEEFAVSIADWGERNSPLAYYLEAYDTLGNGPRYVGNPRSPLVFRAAEVPAADPRPLPGFVLGGLGLFSTVLVGGWLLHRRTRVEAREREPCAAPASTTGPRAGTAIRQPDRDDSGHALGPVDSLEQVADERFWYRLLSPLVEMDRLERREAFARLGTRPQHHPSQGKRIFDLRTLRRQMRWVSRVDPAALERRWEIAESKLGSTAPAEPEGSGIPTGSRRRELGFSLVEVTVVVGLIGIAVVAAALFLRPMEAPLQAGGELVDGMLQLTRAKAMSTTTPHRMRPISATELAVESGPSCTAGPWVVEPLLRLELPEDVTLADAGWSVCFVSRGTATANQVIELEHPTSGSLQLEVLLGGAVRRLP